MRTVCLWSFLLLLVGFCSAKTIEADVFLSNDGPEMIDLWLRSLSEDQCAIDLRVRNSDEEYIGLWTSQPLPKSPKEPQSTLRALPLIVDKADLLLLTVESDGLSTKGKIGWTYLLQQDKDGLKEILAPPFNPAHGGYIFSSQANDAAQFHPIGLWQRVQQTEPLTSTEEIFCLPLANAESLFRKDCSFERRW